MVTYMNRLELISLYQSRLFFEKSLGKNRGSISFLLAEKHMPCQSSMRKMIGGTFFNIDRLYKQHNDEALGVIEEIRW